MVFGKKKKGKSEIPEKSIPPNATVDPKTSRTLEGRRKSINVISEFKGELNLTEDEYIKEQMKTMGKIQLLRRDNERIQRKQESELGMTLDMLDELKISLDKTKSINQKLYEDMEESKSIHDKLEAELKSTKNRFQSAENTLEDLKSKTSMWSETKIKLFKTESRVRDLQEANKNLRFILLSNHINHKADARELSPTKPVENTKSKTHHTIPKVTHRQLSVRPRDKVISTLQQARQLCAEDLKKKYGLKPVHLDQINPDYLGFYLRRKHKPGQHFDSSNMMQKDITSTNYRPGLTLPRIEPRKFDRLVLE